MNFLRETKAIAVLSMTCLASWLGILAVPLVILVLLSTADYFTGLCAAGYRNDEITSYKGLRGIIKKVCLLLVIGIGAAVDWLIMFTTAEVGIYLELPFIVATLVAVWLIVNEIISILENLKDIGVDMPPFLLRIARNIKSKVDEKTEE